MSISDRTVDCPSCSTLLVLSTYNTNICPNCGHSYRKHVEMQAFTELLIRSQKKQDDYWIGIDIAEEEPKCREDGEYFRDKLNTAMRFGTNVALKFSDFKRSRRSVIDDPDMIDDPDIAAIPKEIDENGDMP